MIGTLFTIIVAALIYALCLAIGLPAIVGIVGAFIAGIVIAPMMGTGTINANDFSMASLLVSFLGAVVLLAIVNLFRRRSVR